MTETMRLSVIICTWNRAENLRQTLHSLDQSQLPAETKWEVLIIDNNSTDDTKSVCQLFERQNPDRYRYIFEMRQGKSFAVNTAVEYAKGEILAFTDDDVTMDSAWLSETLRIFETYPCVGVGRRIIAVWKSDKPAWLTLEGPYQLWPAIISYDLGREPCEIKAPPYGANLSLKREVFEKYGHFRTDIGPSADCKIPGEENEFCWRLLHAGEKLIYAPKAIVFHPVEEQRLKKQYFKTWYYRRGQSMARIDPAPADAPRYWGIPRYMIRWYLRDLLLWATSLTPRRRLHYNLQCYFTRGRMMEEKLMSQDRPPAGSA